METNLLFRAAGGTWWAVLALCIVGSIVHGQETEGAAANDRGRVLAYLGEHPLTAADLDFHLGQAGAAEQLSENALANALDLIAKQRQALQTLRMRSQAATQDQVLQWIKENEPQSGSELSEVSQYVEENSAKLGILPETYLDQVAFRISWSRYLAQHLTAENREKHFRNQRQRFDGTLFSVWVLSKPVPAGASLARQRADQELKQLRELTSQKSIDQLTQLAEEQRVEFMHQPRARGAGVLPAEIVDELLRLEPGSTTQPVHSAAGVHLVHLESKTPGKQTLDDVGPEIRWHMLVFLLDNLAKQSEALMPLRQSLEEDTTE